MIHVKSIMRTMVVVLVALLAFSASPKVVQATLLGQNVTVSFLQSGYSDAVDSVIVVPGPELQFGDGSAIDTAGIFLQGESIDIGATSIVYAVRGDGTGNGTGFTGTDGRYLFSNLIWSVPGYHLGSVAISNLDNVTNFSLGTDVQFTANSVTILMANLKVGEIAGAPDLGTISLGLNYEQDTTPPTNPVPEPATFVLLGFGLAGIGISVRRRC